MPAALRITALLAIVIAAGACGGGEEQLPTYTKRDRAIRVEAGDRFVIRLASNPTTGFEWKVSKLPAPLQLVDERFDGPDDPKPGAGGHQLFEFQGLRVGASTLELEYARPSEADVDPVETATFEVKIR
jgi:inhibitor of cysteine peptidase